MYRLISISRLPQKMSNTRILRTIMTTRPLRAQRNTEYPSAYRLHPRRISDCPKCHTRLQTTLPACTNKSCGYIASIPSELQSDYFALFDLPGLNPREGEHGTLEARNSFHIDPKELRSRFLKMQKICHPDRWGASGPVITFPSSRYLAYTDDSVGLGGC